MIRVKTSVLLNKKELIEVINECSVKSITDRIDVRYSTLKNYLESIETLAGIIIKWMDRYGLKYYIFDNERLILNIDEMFGYEHKLYFYTDFVDYWFEKIKNKIPDEDDVELIEWKETALKIFEKRLIKYK